MKSQCGISHVIWEINNGLNRDGGLGPVVMENPVSNSIIMNISSVGSALQYKPDLTNLLLLSPKRGEQT